MKTIELKIYTKIYNTINYLEHNYQLRSFIFNQCCFFSKPNFYYFRKTMKEISLDLKINSVGYGSKIEQELHDTKTINDELYSTIFKILFYDIKQHFDPITNFIINSTKA